MNPSVGAMVAVGVPGLIDAIVADGSRPCRRRERRTVTGGAPGGSAWGGVIGGRTRVLLLSRIYLSFRRRLHPLPSTATT